MSESLALGFLFVFGAGVFQGSFMAPTKWMRGWAWEHYWLIFAITAYLVAPWLIAIATIPRLFEIYAEASRSSLLSVIIYGSGWGIGAVTFGLGVDALGLALGFALILGVATIAGTVIPLLVTPHSGLSGEQIALVTVSLVIMLIGVTVCSFAGKWREKDSDAGTTTKACSSASSPGFSRHAEILDLRLPDPSPKLPRISESPKPSLLTRCGLSSHSLCSFATQATPSINSGRTET